MSGSRLLLCTSCLGPWDSPRFRTCTSCRERGRQTKRKRIAEDPRCRPSSSLSGSRLLLCTSCANPCDSPRFRTCASCRERKREAKRQRVAEDSRASEALTLAVSLLEEEFKIQETASREFPPKISSSHIRTSISKYEDEMRAACQRSICCSCGRFFTGYIYRISNLDSYMLLHQNSLDQCAYDGDSWLFCNLCYTSIMRNSIPKFSSNNFVNVTMCHDYPSVLEELTAVEECLIAKCHPLGTILKLRTGGHARPTNYNALRGHMIVVPQDPGPLLEILPSPELQLDNLIKVFWLGKSAPTNRDLNPFLTVRKDKVLMALQYLVHHNHLYHDLTINRTMIDNWPDEFIPPEIVDNITCLEDPDHHEREGYTVSLETGNYENDFQAAQGEAFHAEGDDLFVTGSVCTDINGERTDADLRLIDDLLGLVTGKSSLVDETAPTAEEFELRERDPPIISYAIRGQATLMSAWKDPSYFTGAFPTLFPKGLGGHKDRRPIAVSLEAFAEWALNHHSRRFARHKTFMYLLYDVLQLRRSSLGHTLLVKRQKWRSVKDDIASLTVEQLQDAANAVSNGQVVANPTIRRLQQDLISIGMLVPESFSQKLTMRYQIKGCIVRCGMPAFWLTINPSDLRNPLVLILAGIEFPENVLPMASAAIRHAAATSNPVAVAQFFNRVCKAIFDGLLQSNTGRMGIFGRVANHFGVVETNGRGMLHLHALVWVSGNLAFNSLRDRLLQDESFAHEMIQYLESIIVQSINSNFQDSTGPADIPPSSKDQVSDCEFHQSLTTDSNAVASKTQIHSSNHTATCFKYHQRRVGKSLCRFGMPRDLRPNSEVDELGVIHLSRNHGWVNPWNPAIASCIRSNHDISWIPTATKCLCLIYYLTNYETKDDVSPYQMLMKAALLKQSIEKAKAALSPDATDLRLREKDSDQFSLRCFNALSHDREISGVQIANSLLQLPTYYTPNYQFTQVNLWWLRRYVRMAIDSISPVSDNSSESTGEEQCTFQPYDTAPISRFDNYKWRGLELADLTFFEYCMLVQIKKRDDKTAFDIDFDSKHPRSGSHIQRLARANSQMMTVSFNGQLSQCQTEEDSIKGGHPATDAIKNDLAEVLLGFFVPWNRLPALFRQYASEYKTKRDACSKIWNFVEPTLSRHNRYFAQNFGLLQKSREDARIDAALRASLDSFDYDVDIDVEPAHIDLDNDDDVVPGQQGVLQISSETLISAYYSVTLSWHKENLTACKRIPSLLSTLTSIQPLRQQNLLPLDICQLPTGAVSGLTFVPNTVLRHWESQIKDLKQLNGVDDMETEERTAFVDDFDLDLGDGALHPTLNSLESIPSLVNRRSQVGSNPSAESLTSLVSKDLPLNRKQRLIVERVFSGALAWSDHAYDASKRKQMLLYVGGEGGTGKTQVIKAIIAGMDLILRKSEVILMAPTGTAADHIGGNTYHTSLGISLAKVQKPTVSARVKRLWSGKTIMIIDEISMVNLTSLSMINNRCKIAKSLHRSSPDLFGGLPIVIFMGDFFQFPPVNGPPLWREPRPDNDEDANGQMIWHRFREVIILDEQMRQAHDPRFRELLARARAAALTEEDLALLNTKVISSLFTPELEGAPIVVQLNALRHHINRTQMEHFARSRSQHIYIFPAQHTRLPSIPSFPLYVEDLLHQSDQGTKIPFQGLFFYTLGMPAVVLANICSNLSVVNGTRGIASGVVVDPTAEFFKIDDLHFLCTKPPACVLFRQYNSKNCAFDNLQPKEVPVFPIERAITIKEYSVRRKQAPICSAFSLTDYKVEGLTLNPAIIDLKHDSTTRSQSEHQKFCSNNVQLSRFKSFDGLHLLREIDMNDLQFHPHDGLVTEMERLRKLEAETLTAWMRT